MRDLGTLGAFRQAVREEVEGVADDVAAKTMLRLRSDPRILKRWMAYSGADDPSGIDYSDPCVMIEYIACDPAMQHLAAVDGEAFLARTGCDRETFMRYYDQSSEDP